MLLRREARPSLLVFLTCVVDVVGVAVLLLLVVRVTPRHDEVAGSRLLALLCSQTVSLNTNQALKSGWGLDAASDTCGRSPGHVDGSQVLPEPLQLLLLLPALRLRLRTGAAVRRREAESTD